MLTKKTKMRILRKYVKWKTDILAGILGLLCIVILAFGLYYISSWGVYGIKYCYHAYILDDLFDMYNYKTEINGDYTFYENGQHSYVMQYKSRKKVLKNINWLSGIGKNDSLMCFAQNGFRGFFNKNNGQVVIPADRYVRAWVFSEGIAAVMEKDSILKFINPNGKVLL